MILSVILWAPCKVARHFLAPVVEMIDTMADNAEAEIQRQSFAGWTKDVEPPLPGSRLKGLPPKPR